jgi:condensin complex subunit 1
LCRLLETHPFGALHGGTLNLEEWQDRYDKIDEELKKVDTIEMEKARRDAGMESEEEEGDESKTPGDKSLVEGDVDGDAKSSEETEEAGDESRVEDGVAGEADESQAKKRKKPRVSTADLAAVSAEQSSIDPALVTRLRLTKKYYGDALKFINQIESAVPTLCQLLVSTTKTEVLESMKFFRTAYEYNISSADTGIKTMLHLIWTKDNNSTTSAGEEGMDGKGVRGSLIEVYRSLYFDVVPELSPKQQVSRITKNMIERTYGATLAELTSLEELMRTMMVDGAVHPDVINKLWQVYGK